MAEVERRLLAWLRERHAFLAASSSFPHYLRECVSSPKALEGQDLVFADISEALDHLERMQRGF